MNTNRLLAALLPGVAIVGCLAFLHSVEVERLRTTIAVQHVEIAWYRELVWTIEGRNETHGPFKIVSFDHGKTWRHFEWTHDRPETRGTNDMMYRHHALELGGEVKPDLIDRAMLNDAMIRLLRPSVELEQ